MRDREFLQRAVEIAAEGIKKGSGPFGAVIVRNGRIISESTNRVVHASDPTAHAEIGAIRIAARLLGTYDLGDCSLYASCEPCPMCLGAIYWAGIKAVYYAADRKDAASAGFSDDYIYNEISLPPEKRSVKFTRLTEVDGIEVFRIWKNFEDKIPY